MSTPLRNEFPTAAALFLRLRVAEADALIAECEPIIAHYASIEAQLASTEALRERAERASI